MAFSIECLSCSAVLNVPEEALGRRVRCPRCQARFVLPKIRLAPPQTDAEIAAITGEFSPNLDSRPPASSSPTRTTGPSTSDHSGLDHPGPLHEGDDGQTTLVPSLNSAPNIPSIDRADRDLRELFDEQPLAPKRPEAHPNHPREPRDLRELFGDETPDHAPRGSEPRPTQRPRSTSSARARVATSASTVRAATGSDASRVLAGQDTLGTPKARTSDLQAHSASEPLARVAEPSVGRTSMPESSDSPIADAHQFLQDDEDNLSLRERWGEVTDADGGSDERAAWIDDDDAVLAPEDDIETQVSPRQRRRQPNDHEPRSESSGPAEEIPLEDELFGDAMGLDQLPTSRRQRGVPLVVALLGAMTIGLGLVATIGLVVLSRSGGNGFLMIAPVGLFAVFAGIELLRLRSTRWTILAYSLGAAIIAVTLIIVPLLEALMPSDDSELVGLPGHEPAVEFQSVRDRINSQQIGLGIFALLGYAGLMAYLTSPSFKRTYSGSY